MQWQQQPAGGKESAPAPNLWSGERHSVRTLQSKDSATSSLFVSPSLSLLPFLFLLLSLLLSWIACCHISCLPVYSETKKTCCCVVYLSKFMSVYVRESWLAIYEFSLWAKGLCIHVCREEPYQQAMGRNQHHSPACNCNWTIQLFSLFFFFAFFLYDFQ